MYNSRRIEENCNFWCSKPNQTKLDNNILVIKPNYYILKNINLININYSNSNRTKKYRLNKTWRTSTKKSGKSTKLALNWTMTYHRSHLFLLLLHLHFHIDNNNNIIILLLTIVKLS